MAENENTGPDNFNRAPGIDYTEADAAIARDKAAGIDAAQDSSHESTSAVSDQALAHHTETLSVVSAVDREAADDLVTAWGKPGSESFQENWAHARHAAQELSSPALQEVLDGAGLGDHPLILRLAADIGRRMAEGGSNTGLTNVAATPANIGARETINDELGDLMGLMSTDLDKYKSPAVQRRIDALTTALVGRGVAVGHAGRTS